MDVYTVVFKANPSWALHFPLSLVDEAFMKDIFHENPKKKKHLEKTDMSLLGFFGGFVSVEIKVSVMILRSLCAG